MNFRQTSIAGLALLLALAAGACSSGGAPPVDPAEPAFSTLLFSAGSAQVDNTYFPLVPGRAYTYQAETEDGLETIVVEVLDETRVVAGVECIVVRDRVYLDGLLIEDTHDWYAQDDEGNVWYMGEEVVNYEYDDDDNVIGTDSDGAWEAGVDGAEPGIYMKATLVPGDTYRQEYYEGEAEDMGEIIALNVLVTLADGSLYSCLQTRDTDPLDPGPAEFKYYAAGLGLVLEEKEDGSERADFMGMFDLGEDGFPDFDGASFTDPANVTNPLFPLVPGTVQTYTVETEDGVETVVSEVLDETRVVDGVECRVVRVREYLDELLVEDTRDWYAQDDAGNVWYMGEDVTNYEYDDDDVLLETNDDGAWEAGVDDAEPGIIMWAAPAVGQSYRQEYYEEEAEDLALVVATGVTVEVGNGTTYAGCLKTLEWTPLEPSQLEYKYYAPGVGLVREEPLEEDAEPLDLQGVFDLGDAGFPDYDGATFTNPTQITNTYLPFAPGTVLEYEQETEDGLEETVVEVLATTRVVDGIECVIVRDRVYLDGLLIEDTHDWFAQDDDGNVWYMGEEVVNYEYDDDDMLLGTDDEGSWEAGVDDAEPGIVMWASPVVGWSYRQEYYEDEAEDMAVVVALGVTVELEDGTTFVNCLKTLEWSPLEPFALEYKYYAPGVGVVLEETAGDGARVELVDGP